MSDEVKGIIEGEIEITNPDGTCSIEIVGTDIAFRRVEHPYPAYFTHANRHNYQHEDTCPCDDCTEIKWPINDLPNLILKLQEIAED